MNDKPRPSIGGIFDIYISAVCVDYVLYDPQPQTGSLVLSREEGVPYLSQNFLRYTASLVRDDHFQYIRFGLNLEDELASIRHRLQGVDENVEKCLIEHVGVRSHRR